jgi:arsenate reductase-like glutaredoxin family protein
MSCRTYRLKRQLMIRIAKQHKNEPKSLKFAHLFKNAITVDEILKFLKKTEIVIRNWLQNQSKIEEEVGVKREKK